MVRQKERSTLRIQPHLVGVILAGQRRGAETGADLQALHRIDRHQGRGQFRVQLTVQRRAPSGGQSCDLQRHHRPDGRAGLAHRIQIDFPVAHDLGRCGEQRIGKGGVEVDAVLRDPVRTQLHHARADPHVLADHLPRHGSGRDPAGRFARGRPPAAAIIPHPVFGLIGVVGVAGAKGARDLAVILGALVLVRDQDGDRRAGGHRSRAVVEHPRQDLRGVALVPLGDEAAAAGLSPVQPRLDVGRRQGNPWRRPVDHAADGRPMAFAPGRDAKQMAEGVVRHG